MALAVVAAAVLQLLLPDQLLLHPRLLLPGLELTVLLGLVVADPGRIERRHPALRTASLALVALVMLANAASAVRLVEQLLHDGAAVATSSMLLGSGSAVYGTNVIAFALWYWETDRGGPAERAHGGARHPDLLFAQMTAPELAPADWEPRFADYLYLSFTNSTAFSPTDTLPLTRWTKAVMAVQSTVALVVVGLVVARAVNILG